MITSKYLAPITAILVAISLVFCGWIVYAADTYESTHVPIYQTKLFGGEIITIDIQVDEDDWQSLLDNAMTKEWIPADLIINGERFSAVGIRTKGNSSLSQAIQSGNGRYSLQLKANHYIKGQTFYGLDTFCINNLMGDSTYMKDYLSYEIFKFIGVETPLVNYADVTVNGESYGFCIALERYDEAFLNRAFNTSGGQLYNVKIGMGMRGNFEDLRQDGANIPAQQVPNNVVMGGQQPDDGALQSGVLDSQQDGAQQSSAQQSGAQQSGAGASQQNRPQGGPQGGGQGGPPQGVGPGAGMGGPGGPGGGSGGGSLLYTSDDISSYSAIFDNSVFKSTDKDKQRVITAIKNLSAGTDLEKYFDVDEILRYFAAHTVVVNLDSYVSNMQQNYYIYERDGKITILPWDYGLAFGGFQSGDASSVVNFPIDTPVSGVSMEDRPLLNKLLEVDEYRERYHEYLRQIVEGYIESGLFESALYSMDAKISDYVKNDASAYVTYDQYKASLPVLVELVRLRAESILGQLNGTIPSTTSGQSEDSSSLVDASSINLSALGTMGGPGGGGGGPGGQIRPGG